MAVAGAPAAPPRGAAQSPDLCRPRQRAAPLTAFARERSACRRHGQLFARYGQELMTMSALPFLGLLGLVLPILERRVSSPVFSCRICGNVWSASLSERDASPETWWQCPRGCDALRKQVP